jgi:hypothetical protein
MKKCLITILFSICFFVSGCNLWGGGLGGAALWDRPKTTRNQTENDMEACGYSFGTRYVSSDNYYALNEICMLKKGYKSTSSEYLMSCYGTRWNTIPACIEYKRGGPLSAEELEKIETEVQYIYKWKWWKKLGWWKVGVEKPEEVWVDLNGKRVESEEIINRNKAKVKLVTDQMMTCGYPKIGSSRLEQINETSEKKTVSYAELGRMERCMEKAGYEYEYPNLRVCVMYQQIRGCE